MMKKRITCFFVFCVFLSNPHLTGAIDKTGKMPVENKVQDAIQKQMANNGEFFFGYLNLAGTVLVSEKDRKLNKAVFADVFTKKKVTFQEGSLLPYGIKLKKVAKDRVVLEKKGQEKILTLGDRRNYFREIKTLKRKGYQKIAPNEWIVNSHYLFKNSEDMIKSAVDSGLALKKSNKISGIEIANDADNKMAGLGFKKGDKVIDINGTSLDGMKGLISAYQNMKNSDSVTIKVLRNGKPIELNYWTAKRGSPRYNMKQVLDSEKIKKLLSM